MSKKFQRKVEDFVCRNCGLEVKGSGYTNHCPACFFSLHVDNFPGDRANDCGGLMEPVNVEIEKGEYSVVQRCQKCGFQKKNKLSEEDDLGKLAEIIKRKNEKII